MRLLDALLGRGATGASSSAPVQPLVHQSQPDPFDRAVEVILAHEGGYVNDPRDPGGETKYGITKRTYPDLDIKNLTVEQAKAIYRRDFWDKLRCGEMPWPVALAVFDAAVNQGPAYAARTLQMILKVAADGVVGPVTLGALRTADPAKAALEFQVQRVLRYAALPGWGTYGLGWTRRVMDVTAWAVG